MKTKELKECNKNDLRKQYPRSHFLDEKFDHAIMGVQPVGTTVAAVKEINKS